MSHDQQMTAPAPTREEQVRLDALYRDFEAGHMVPLWTEIGNLMAAPEPAAVPFVWEWNDLLPLAERAGDLVPVGRGGERRAIALANPGLGGRPYATATLWCAIQYLGGHEVAPEHRHSENAFHFVAEGEGVWTSEQLAIEDEGYPATVGPGHAAVRYVNPTTGGDVMPTIRAEFHRFRPGAATRTTREVGSSVYQVFEGRGHFVLDGQTRTVETGDLVVVPSWTACQIQDGTGFDLFRFGDQPIVEKLDVARTDVEDEQ